MTSATASAPGKIILFGEHAVVYGQPALAVPLTDISAVARVTEGEPGTGVRIDAPDIDRHVDTLDSTTDPLGVTVRLVLDALRSAEPDAHITIESSIPIAAGLGSGAAVSAAVARALATFLGRTIEDGALSELVFQVEKLHHGTPSGIDNAVICYGRPIYFVKSQPPEMFSTAVPLHIIIGDTGVASPTKVAVAAVRAAWEQNTLAYERHFANIGEIVKNAREAVSQGKVSRVGELMNENQAILRQIDVSSPDLERLVDAALSAGAIGAKLSGGGRGGNMIALVNSQDISRVESALLSARAVRVMNSTIS